MKTKRLYWTTGSGRIELEMTLKQAKSVSHSGDCELDVNALIPQLKSQLDNLDPHLLATELKEYGAWDDAELKSHPDNLQRVVWIAGCDLVEGK